MTYIPACSPYAQPRSVHMVGVCGSGMKALAEVLIGRGWQVSGSDLQGESAAGEGLKRLGVHVVDVHSAANIAADVSMLLFSTAIKSDNPELRWAVEHGIPTFAYHEFLGRLMQERVGISIAGTHGKSTTTALTGCILTAAGLAPTVLVGAEVCGRDANGWTGNGAHVVVESCEYQRHFLSLRPRMAAILGIEPDHFDCFDDLDATVAAFREFASLLPADGVVVIHQGCEASRVACDGVAARVETFGIEDAFSPDSGEAGYIGEADWAAVDIEKVPLGHRFQILHDGVEFCTTELRIPGRHHVLNALAAAALCHRAGASPAQIADGIRQFRGIRRRFEVLGECDGVTLVDDYAHHPTAIRATLRTAREEFGNRRLICVFQPHQVSRTMGLLDEFSRSFEDADEVWILPVFGARESYQRELIETSSRLAEMIAAQGVAARFSPSLDQTRASLDDTLRPQDVLLTLGAGDIDRIHHASTRRL